VGVLFVFVDGIGLGRPGAHNPFDGAPIEILAPLADPDREGARGVAYAAIDATLGHPGLPQSATGQGVLFTGRDVIAVAGGHREGYPTRAIAEVIRDESFLRRAREPGKRAGLLNAYDEHRAAMLTSIARGEMAYSRRLRPSASSMAALAGGGTLRTFDDVREGRAATFDLTGDVLRAFGIGAPKKTVREAARAIAAGARELDLALFEIFTTDKAGHAQDMTWARLEIVKLERFLSELFAAIDPDEQTVIVTSDHGNLEDLSTRSHTRAEVPLVAFGAGSEDLVRSAKSILDVAPRCLVLSSAAKGSLP
jgi:hypothetical protein